MNAVRKFMGIVWMALGVYAGYFMLTVLGLPKLNSGKQDDLVFGIIIVFILLPLIVGGLLRFGSYALMGEFDEIGKDHHIKGAQY